MDARTSLWREAEGQEIDVTGVPDYPAWRQEAGRLTAAGKAILSDKKTYGPHLDKHHDWREPSDMGALQHQPRHRR